MSVNPGIETVTEIEAWELTLPEDEAACEDFRGCDTSATWRGIGTCCARAVNLCDPHRDIEPLSRPGAVIERCVGCATRGGRVIWHRI